MNTRNLFSEQKGVMSVDKLKFPGHMRNFFLATAVLVLCFSKPLYDLLRFAVEDDLYSYIPLIPMISVYLVWLQRGKSWPSFVSGRKPATIFLAGGLVMLAGYRFVIHSASPANEDYLAATIFAFLLFFTAISCLFLGKNIARMIAVPISLLVFIIPFPVFVRHEIETFLQYGSAAVANGLFQMSGMPVYQDGLMFRLPGFNLEVAPECSGIRSSLVLFITSLLAAYLFLRTPWKRATLVLAVIPLALLRNGFRIFVIGQLCVRIGPEMINSFIHRHGGPLFFALSLIPLFLLLLLFRKSERAIRKSPPQPSKI
jgi:exosortase C (VPDSG-CTERM-specific)